MGPRSMTAVFVIFMLLVYRSTKAMLPIQSPLKCFGQVCKCCAPLIPPVPIKPNTT
jgi:hypothetical protein